MNKRCIGEPNFQKFYNLVENRENGTSVIFDDVNNFEFLLQSCFNDLCIVLYSKNII